MRVCMCVRACVRVCHCGYVILYIQYDIHAVTRCDTLAMRVSFANNNTAVLNIHCHTSRVCYAVCAAPVCFDVPVQWSAVFIVVETSGVVSNNQRWHFTGRCGSRRANKNNFSRSNKLANLKHKLAPQRYTKIIAKLTVSSFELDEPVSHTGCVSFNVTSVSD